MSISSEHFVKDDWEPHPSHQMGEWRGTIIAMASNDRFAQIRNCLGCSSEEAKVGGAGAHIRFPELDVECLKIAT